MGTALWVCVRARTRRQGSSLFWPSLVGFGSVEIKQCLGGQRALPARGRVPEQSTLQYFRTVSSISLSNKSFHLKPPASMAVAHPFLGTRLPWERFSLITHFDITAALLWLLSLPLPASLLLCLSLTKSTSFPAFYDSQAWVFRSYIIWAQLELNAEAMMPWEEGRNHSLFKSIREWKDGLQ